MCTFCGEHGRGEKWYFQFENYLFQKVFPTSDEQQEARKRSMKTFADTDRYGDPEYAHDMDYLREKFAITPGQVITLEEAKRVMNIAKEATEREDTMMVLARCNCAFTHRGKVDYRCIVFGIPVSWASEIGYARYPKEGLTEFGGAEWKEIRQQLNRGLKVPLKAEEAEELLVEWNRQGLIHTLVSRGLLPLIDGICNCEKPYCMRNRHRFLQGLTEHVLLKGHFVARIDPQLCTACGQCMDRCPFGAVQVSKWMPNALVDVQQCFGCGLCVTTCKNEAIKFVPREEIPLAKNLW